jgi:hypothetical protein
MSINNQIIKMKIINKIQTCFDFRLIIRRFRGFFGFKCSISLPFSSSDESSDGE